MLGFLFGAVAGAVAATYWRNGVSRFRKERVPGLRHQAADKLEAAERAVVHTLDAASAKVTSRLRGGQMAETATERRLDAE
jgi:hypothetical protein